MHASQSIQSLVALRILIVSFSVMSSDRVSPISNYSLRLNPIHTGFFGLDAIDAESAPSRLRGMNHHLVNDL